MKHWFLLRRQPVGEQDHLLDLLTEHQGVVRVRVSPPVLTPDLLTEYRGDWQSGRDWPRLRGVESVQRLGMRGDALVCALYVSELLLQLLPVSDEQPQIYPLYRQTLLALNEGGASDVWLRFFEMQLLDHLGYGLSWSVTLSGDPVVAQQHYVFEPGQGLVLIENGGSQQGASKPGVSGADLLAIAAGELNTPAALTVARQILRQAIHHLLPRPLVSRELLIRG